MAAAPERAWPEPKMLEKAGDALARNLSRGWRSPSPLADALVQLVRWKSRTLDRLSDAELTAAAAALRPRLLARGLRPDLVAEAFALAREATHRRLGIRQHPVQIVGAATMLRGRVAEMATGEGKTATGILTAATAALAGLPVHVVTVNDYLAGRDAEHLRPVYELLGLGVGLIESEMDRPARRAAYAADVVFVTNKDLVFDYLRDRVAQGEAGTRMRALTRRVAQDPKARDVVLRGLWFALVDELDSILIDEAQTPLIIAAERPADATAEAYRTALAVAATLAPGADYSLDEERKSVDLTDAGRAKVGGAASPLAAHWKAKRAREDVVEQALSALAFFHLDQQYILRDGKVQIVDEFTGRVLADRQWRSGLHQLVEVKEGLEPSARRETLAEITYQQFFRRYLRLAGMTGTGAEVARELKRDFDLTVVRVPTHRPSRRVILRTRLFTDRAGKEAAIAAEALRVAGAGRPVLVGTRSVDVSERLAERLRAASADVVVLNARQDAGEAELIGEAGRAGRITVATNMAGRGTDIRIPPEVCARGGLHVIVTEFHESARIDRQLIGRSGRQGDPGSAVAMVALDDEILCRFAPSLVAAFGRIAAALPPGLRWPVAELLRTVAQAKANRVAAATRKATLDRVKTVDRQLAFGKRPA